MMCFSWFKFKNRSRSAPDLGKKREEVYAHSKKTRASKSASPLGRIREKEKRLRVFSLSELAEATSSFNRLVLIGRGGFGNVYKGEIKPVNGHAPLQIVAIKKLNPRGLQGHKQWVTEVRFLGVLDHPNLVKLLGYCSVDGERGIHRLLVYEYMPNKSLEDHLFNRSAPVVDWITRLKIILGAAQGMAYLHEGFETQVIHRDFKSSNVLLDKDFNAKLSDFGLAREGPTGDQTHVSTMPVGTQGYAAPEYAETGRLTVKSDIYSFGVVLYEILTGRRTVERDLPSPEQKLIEWVRESPPDTNRFILIMDPRLQNAYDIRAARRIARLADKCLSKNPKDRPTMSQVVEILQQALEEPKRNPMSVPSKPPNRNRAATVIPGKLPQPAQA